MSSIEEIRRITILASTKGVDQAKAELDGLAASQTKVAATAEGMAVAHDRVDKSTLSAASRFEGLRRSIDPAYKAQQQFERGQRTVATAMNQGAIGADVAARTLDTLRQRYERVRDAAGEASDAHEEHAESMRKARKAARELNESFRSIGEGVAEGGNPFGIAAIQLGRLSSAATVDGGFKEFLGSAGAFTKRMFSPLANPYVAGAAGLATLVGGAGYSYFQREQDLTRLQVSLNGPGRATGLTMDGLAEIAGRFGDRTGLTRGSANELAAGFAATGHASPDQIEQLGGMSKRFAQVTGQELGEAGKQLAEFAEDPVKGLDLLSSKIGEFDAHTRQLVASAAASGDAFGALGIGIDAVSGKVSLLSDRSWTLANAWGNVKSKVSGFFDTIGGSAQFAFDPTPDQQLKEALEKQEKLHDEVAQGAGSWAEAHGLGNRPAADLDAVNKQVADLQQQVREEAARAAQAKAVEDAAYDSNRAAAAIRTLSPDQAARQDAMDRKKLLEDVYERAKKDPALAKALRPGFDELTGAPIDGLTDTQQGAKKAAAVFDDLQTPMQRLITQTNAAIAAMNARTLAEKIAAEQEKLLADLGKSREQQGQNALQVEAKRVELLSQANRALEDSARQSQDQLALAGLKPFDRAMQEIQFKDRDRRENYVFGTPSTAPALPAIPRAAGAPEPPSPYGALDNPFAGAVTVGTPKSALSPAQQLAVLAAAARQEGSPGNRPDYNNPGNIMFGRWAAGAGATGSGLGGVAKFPSLDAGLAAQRSVVFGQNPSETLGEMSYRYLGHGTGGDAPLYASRLAAAANHAVGSYGSTATPAGWPVAAPPAVQPGAANMAAGAMSNDQAAYWKNYAGDTGAASKAVEQAEAQSKLLDVQRDMWGQTAAAVAKATSAQEMWNRVAADGITQQGLVNKFGADGVTMWNKLGKSIDASSSAQGATAGHAAQQQQQLGEINGLNDMARSFTSGSLGDIANDFSQSTTKQDILGQLTRGQQNSYYTGHTSLNQAKWEAAQRQVQSLASKMLINYGVGEVTKGIFGSGSVGSAGYQPGLLGGFLTGGLSSGSSFLSGLFGGGAGVLPGGSPLGMGGIGMAHGGAIVGMETGGSRYVDASVFAGAPRFHDGGIVGGEVPIIAKRNEGVFTPGQMKALSPAGGGGVTIHHAPQTNITVQGDVSEKTMPMIQAAIAQNNVTQAKSLQRTINGVMSNNSKLYG
jgi:hypothetical protein